MSLNRLSTRRLIFVTPLVVPVPTQDLEMTTPHLPIVLFLPEAIPC